MFLTSAGPGQGGGGQFYFFIKTSCKYTVFIDDVSLFEDANTHD